MAEDDNSQSRFAFFQKGAAAASGANPAEDPQAWTALRQFIDGQEAQVIAAKLRAAGIDCHLGGGNMAAIQPGVQPTLYVRARDRFRVHHLLAEQAGHGASHTGGTAGTSAPLQLDAARPHVRPADHITGDEVYCPSCGSHLVTPIEGEISTRLPVIGSLSVFRAKADDRWFKCGTCGTQFRDRLDRSGSMLIGVMWAGLIALATYGLLELITWIKKWPW